MTNYLQKIKQLDNSLGNKKVHNQVEEIDKLVATVAEKKVLSVAPLRLGFLPDEFEDLLVGMGSAKKNELTTLNHLLNSARQFLSLKYWSVPNLKTANLIKRELHIASALEIMAGNAYWSKALNEVDIDTIATDSLEWAKTSQTGEQMMMPVKNYAAEVAIKKFDQVDLIICSWSPNFGDSDLSAVRAWRDYNPNSKLLFIGEKNGATNSPQFWENEQFVKTEAISKINASFKSFDFIDEQFFEIK